MKTRTPFYSSVGAVLLSLCSVSRATITPLVTSASGSLSYQDVNVGYQFTANTALTINALGVYDAAGAAGLAAAEPVGIYSTTGTLLASATVPAGTSAPLVDGFQWVDLSTPLHLTAGQTYVADVYATTADGWLYYATVTTSPSITIGIPVATYAGPGLVYPGPFFGYGPYYGPNLSTGSIGAVPEPTTMISGALLLLPFGSSALRQLRKKFQAA